MAFPRIGHNVLRKSFVGGGAITCGLELMADFIADPCAELDTSCTEKMLPIEFDPAGLDWMFGTESLWVGAP